MCSITPFARDGSLDEPAAHAHFRRMADAGVGVYAGGSSPGEQYALVSDEVECLLRAAVAECRGRVPVRAMGVEPRHAREMREFAALAARCGVDALQIYSLDVGHGSQPAPDELEHYFCSVLESTELPCVLSSHFLGGYVLPEALIERLVGDYSHVIGLNVSTNDIAYLSRVIERVAGRAEVHVGGPLHALSALALGGSGFLSAEGNIAPRLARAVTDAVGPLGSGGRGRGLCEADGAVHHPAARARGRQRPLDQGRARATRPAGRRAARAERSATPGRARAHRAAARSAADPRGGLG